jgi:Ca2+-binding RTX toxin-like protein
VLIGNAGNDSLYGGAGDDTLYGKDSLFDLLDGGIGDDLATWDAKDALLDLFSTPA